MLDRLHALMPKTRWLGAMAAAGLALFVLACPARAQGLSETARRQVAKAAEDPYEADADAKAQLKETPAERDARMQWWRDARFGLFIHWGLYAVPAGDYKGNTNAGNEWMMFRSKIPVAEYAEYAKQFDAKNFDAEAWVKLAKNAGMKYIVITAKHHEGFAMYDTKIDDYNIVKATPFKRDPLRELADACRKHDLRLGFYYSQGQDWYHPGGGFHKGKHYDPVQKGDFKTYFKTVAEPQVKELLTNYGPVATLWFDTPTYNMTSELGESMTKLVRSLQPGIIINNRLGGGWKGDYGTPEQFIPPQGEGELQDWETCMTINGSWGFIENRKDQGKSTKELLRDLFNTASQGANYLLNVGPDKHGVIPPLQVQRLRELGEWIRPNGEAVYATRRSPFKQPFPFGYITAKPGKLYLTVFDWPADGKLWLPIRNADAVKSGRLLRDAGAPATTAAADGGVVVTLPSVTPDPLATVVVLEHEGGLQTYRPPVTAGKDGSFVLTLPFADIKASIARLARGPKGRIAGMELSRPESSVTWEIAAGAAGEYRVEMEAAAVLPTDKGEVTVTAGGEMMRGIIQGQGNQEVQIVPVALGTLKLPAGALTVTVTAKGEGKSRVRVYSLKLTPVAPATAR